MIPKDEREEVEATRAWSKAWTYADQRAIRDTRTKLARIASDIALLRYRSSAFATWLEQEVNNLDNSEEEQALFRILQQKYLSMMQDTPNGDEHDSDNVG